MPSTRYAALHPTARSQLDMITQVVGLVVVQTWPWVASLCFHTCVYVLLPKPPLWLLPSFAKKVSHPYFPACMYISTDDLHKQRSWPSDISWCKIVCCDGAKEILSVVIKDRPCYLLTYCWGEVVSICKILQVKHRKHCMAINKISCLSPSSTHNQAQNVPMSSLSSWYVDASGLGSHFPSSNASARKWFCCIIYMVCSHKSMMVISLPAHAWQISRESPCSAVLKCAVDIPAPNSICTISSMDALSFKHCD